MISPSSRSPSSSVMLFTRRHSPQSLLRLQHYDPDLRRNIKMSGVAYDFTESAGGVMKHNCAHLLFETNVSQKTRV